MQYFSHICDSLCIIGLDVPNCRLWWEMDSIEPWINYALFFLCGLGSVVSIATGWGSNPGGGEIFRTCPDRSWGPPSLLYNEYRVFPGAKERPGRDANPSHFLVLWSWKSGVIPLLARWAVRTVQGLYKGALYLFTGFYKSSTSRLEMSGDCSVVRLCLCVQSA